MFATRTMVPDDFDEVAELIFLSTNGWYQQRLGHSIFQSSPGHPGDRELSDLGYAWCPFSFCCVAVFEPGLGHRLLLLVQDPFSAPEIPWGRHLGQLRKLKT